MSSSEDVCLIGLAVRARSICSCSHWRCSSAGDVHVLDGEVAAVVARGLRRRSSPSGVVVMGKGSGGRYWPSGSRDA